MQTGFEIKDGSVPVVYIDGEKMALVSLYYGWHTETDTPGEGRNVCIAEGFLEGEPDTRRIVFDFSKKIEKEQETNE